MRTIAEVIGWAVLSAVAVGAGAGLYAIGSMAVECFGGGCP